MAASRRAPSTSLDPTGQRVRLSLATGTGLTYNTRRDPTVCDLHSPRERRLLLCAAATGLLAFALRRYRIGSPELWVDEAASERELRADRHHERNYRTADDTGFERTARALLAQVRKGDVVVFTDLRGLPILYQLAQLGYRWEHSFCTHVESRRRFACRMFPLETEHKLATYRPERIASTPTAAREDVAANLGDLGVADSTVHVVFGKFATAQGKLAVTDIDSRLIAELDRAGFEAVAADVPLGMISYRRNR